MIDTDEIEVWLRQINSAPEDKIMSGAFSDWLRDRGDDERADLVLLGDYSKFTPLYIIDRPVRFGRKWQTTMEVEIPVINRPLVRINSRGRTAYKSVVQLGAMENTTKVDGRITLVDGYDNTMWAGRGPDFATLHIESGDSITATAGNRLWCGGQFVDLPVLFSFWSPTPQKVNMEVTLERSEAVFWRVS